MSNLDVVYRTARDGIVCFYHAVQAALDSRNVETTIEEDLNSEYRIGRTWCDLCKNDHPKE